MDTPSSRPTEQIGFDPRAEALLSLAAVGTPALRPRVGWTQAVPLDPWRRAEPAVGTAVYPAASTRITGH